jgi:hypothetical protein
MTDAQASRIRALTVQFGCPDDYAVREHSFDTPPGWALVTMGERKGRRRSFSVSPSGEVKA